MEQLIEKILHKEFSNKIKGYDRDQVDTFLDEIIENIEQLEKKQNLLFEEKKLLEKNNFELKMKLLSMQEQTPQNAYQDTLAHTKVVTPPNNQQLEPFISNNNLNTNVQSSEKNVVSNELMNENQQATKSENASINEYTLQDRIEQLEKELTNIKNISE